MFYRPNSEHSRVVEDFIRDLQRQHGLESNHLEILDVDSRDGSATASLYDVVAYPAIIATADDGSILKSWDDGQLPLMNEVVGYTFAY